MYHRGDSFWGANMPSNIIENLDLKKPSFRHSKWPQKLKPAKNSKLPKLPENCFEPVGKGGWPPISTWIKHTLRAWYANMDSYLLSQNFVHCKSNPNVYMLRTANSLLLLVL
jgi:hypothetical protein